MLKKRLYLCSQHIQIRSGFLEQNAKNINYVASRIIIPRQTHIVYFNASNLQRDAKFECERVSACDSFCKKKCLSF